VRIMDEYIKRVLMKGSFTIFMDLVVARLIHEYGHMIAAEYLGYPAFTNGWITILPNIKSLPPEHIVIISLMGPLFQLFFVFALFIVDRYRGDILYIQPFFLSLMFAFLSFTPNGDMTQVFHALGITPLCIFPRLWFNIAYIILYLIVFAYSVFTES